MTESFTGDVLRRVVVPRPGSGRNNECLGAGPRFWIVYLSSHSVIIVICVWIVLTATLD